MVGIMAEGNFLEVVKAFYRLTTSGNMWHSHLSHTLRAMIFKPTHFDPGICIRGHKGGYDYIGTHTNNVLVVAVDPTYVFNKLKDTYKFKDLGRQKFTLAVNNHSLRWVLLFGGSWVPPSILQNGLESFV